LELEREINEERRGGIYWRSRGNAKMEGARPDREKGEEVFVEPEVSRYGHQHRAPGFMVCHRRQVGWVPAVMLVTRTPTWWSRCGTRDVNRYGHRRWGDW
jgi:hypothetical protein